MSFQDNFNFLLKKNHYQGLENFSVLKVSGKDCLIFLQGQTTNDIKSLKSKCFCLNARLDRGGHLKTYFYTLKCQEYFYLICPNNMISSLKEELEKYIIMEDVEIAELKDLKVYFTFDPTLLIEKNIESFRGEIFGEEGSLFLNGDEIFLEGNKKYDSKMVQNLFKANGFSCIYGENKKELIGDTIFNQHAINYNKGCFLGSEVVSKIENGRGGAYYPALLKVLHKKAPRFLTGETLYINEAKAGVVVDILDLKDDLFYCVQLMRNFRVENMEAIVSNKNNSLECIILNYPLFKNSTFNLKSIDFYNKGLNEFVLDHEDLAIEDLESSLRYNPNNSDALETLGVIYGRHQDFNKAIEMMDRLLISDPTSVMAHTNKSLYLMKLGKIDEAEEEKSKATIKSFSKFGEEADVLEEKERQKAMKLKENEKRKSMFLQVLEIDEEDLIANMGLADICYFEENYNDSLLYLDKIYPLNKNNSHIYFLKAKNMESLGNFEEAQALYKKGTNLASSKGEMKLANEMQAKLLALKNMEEGHNG